MPLKHNDYLLNIPLNSVFFISVQLPHVAQFINRNYVVIEHMDKSKKKMVRTIIKYLR